MTEANEHAYKWANGWTVEYKSIIYFYSHISNYLRTYSKNSFTFATFKTPVKTICDI